MVGGVRPHGDHSRVRPAELARVERQGRLGIGRMQLMPAPVTSLARPERRGGALLDGCDEVQQRALRIRDHRDAPDARHADGWRVYDATGADQSAHGLVEVGHRDVREPARRHARGRGHRRDLHDPGNTRACDLEQAVVDVGLPGVTRGPSEQLAVERGGRARIAGHQFVPDKRAIHARVPPWELGCVPPARADGGSLRTGGLTQAVDRRRGVGASPERRPCSIQQLGRGIGAMGAREFNVPASWHVVKVERGRSGAPWRNGTRAIVRTVP